MQMQVTTHTNYMALALELAQRGRLTVSPNPMVGCVIVKDNQIVGQGFHQRAGEPHAEIYALQEAGSLAAGAIAYVSLEPCCHQNRTPPCTRSLIQAGIKKVFVACLDPNPLVAGKGIEALKSAGIEVEISLLEKEAIQLNEVFFHYMTHKRPFVIAKWAMSLDGKTITNPVDSKSISCAASRRTTHLTRQQTDAILVGANTAEDDDPLLTVRLEHEDGFAPKHPLRIILSSRGKLPPQLKLFDTSTPGKTIVATTNKIDKETHQSLTDKNIEIIILPQNKHGQVDLPALLDELGRREITSLLVEGGMTVHESFFQQNLVNKVHVYLAPVIIGTLEKKRVLNNVHVANIEHDFYFSADYQEPLCSLE